MSRINGGRVLMGGLVAGLIMNLIDACTNAILLATQWNTETMQLNPGLMAKAGNSAMLGWIIVDFLLGILIVWVYAAMRPRFGAGSTTAMRAALLVWLASHLTYMSYVFMGLYSLSLIGMSTLGGLVAALAGGYIGCWLYREDGIGA